MCAAVHAFAATTHGRYLVRAASPAAPVLVGFHGYAESCESQMERLAAMPGADAWTLVSIQGLHRFYRPRSDQVVASWMTRQDRELAIADNVAYVDGVVASMPPVAGAPLVFAGFSQGVSMAFRAACLGHHRVTAVVACGGDVPPELTASQLRLTSRALLARGRDDAFYREAAMAADVERLEAAGAVAQPVTFEGGHEWPTAFAATVGAFLRELAR